MLISVSREKIVEIARTARQASNGRQRTGSSHGHDSVGFHLREKASSRAPAPVNRSFGWSKAPTTRRVAARRAATISQVPILGAENFTGERPRCSAGPQAENLVQPPGGEWGRQEAAPPLRLSAWCQRRDRKSVVSGKRVDLGGP